MATIALAADHAGDVLIELAAETIRACGHGVLRVGEALVSPVDDYPDFAELVARAVQDGQAERAVLICGSGVGASVAASKFRGIRAAVCHDAYSAAQGVEHDDMNVLCLGSRVIGSALARTLIVAYLGARFTGEERHVRRLAKVAAFEGAG